VSDFLTILHSVEGKRLTKKWNADGTISSYDTTVRNFRVETAKLAGIRDLSAQLTRIEPMTSTEVIRGAPVAGINMERTRRLNVAFADVPRHWVCFDIDHHMTALDIQADPAAAAREFISQCLPDGFQEISCHWQQSASAGAPGKEGKLKMHLWFWLDKAWHSWEVKAWAEALGLPVDLALFQQVQQHYTAVPVLDEGVVCPVRQRSGFIEGLLGDEAHVEMPKGLQIVQPLGLRKGMKDPREKDGLIGTFCRLYPPERVIDEDLCEGMFEWQNDDNVRITWIGSASGAAGGVFVTEDGLHLGCSHGGDPHYNRAVNVWDFIRLHKFGELDEHIDPDAVQWLMSQGGMPSHVAMKAWVQTLPDVAEELAAGEAERQEQQEVVAQKQQSADADLASRAEQKVQSAIDRVVACASAADLERVLCPQLKVVRSQYEPLQPVDYDTVTVISGLLGDGDEPHPGVSGFLCVRRFAGLIA
jgi:hypothetical protein